MRKIFETIGYVMMILFVGFMAVLMVEAIDYFFGLIGLIVVLMMLIGFLFLVCYKQLI